MTLYASKPSFNIREKLKELQAPIGAMGGSLLATNTRQEVSSILGIGQKNLIINGDMKISQRGDFTTLGSNGIGLNDYTVDRWYFNSNAYGTDYFQHVEANQPPGSSGKSIKMEVRSTDVKYRRLSQIFEEYQRFKKGRPFAVSFKYKANNASNRLHCGFWINNLFYKLSGLRSTSDWTYFSKVFWCPVDAPSSPVTSFAIGFATDIGGATGGSIGDFVEFTQVQVEEGITSSPYESRSYGEELDLCQRYFQSHSSGDLYTGFGNAHANNSAYVEIYGYEYIKEMRAAPSLSVSSAGDFSIRTSSNAVHGSAAQVNLNRPGTQKANISFASSGLTTGASYHIVANGTATATLNFDAEL